MVAPLLIEIDDVPPEHLQLVNSVLKLIRSILEHEGEIVSKRPTM